MCHLIYRVAILATLLVTFSCTKDSEGPQTDERGLTSEIRDLVPEQVLQAVEDLGQPINGGNNPPDITGVFFSSPVTVTASSLDDDPFIIGDTIRTQQFTFSNQSQNFQVDLLTEFGDGGYIENKGSFLVGKGCRFTVFTEKVNEDARGGYWTILGVISGCVEDSGIEDLSFSYVMLDDNGNPHGTYWQVGQVADIRTATVWPSVNSLVHHRVYQLPNADVLVVDLPAGGRGCSPVDF